MTLPILVFSGIVMREGDSVNVGLLSLISVICILSIQVELRAGTPLSLAIILISNCAGKASASTAMMTYTEPFCDTPK